MFAQFPSAVLNTTIGTRAKDSGPAAGATGDATVCRLNPLVGEARLAERTVFALLARAIWTPSLPDGLRHQLRSRQNRNRPTPKTKKSKNRAKKRGPIIAEIKKNNLLD